MVKAFFERRKIFQNWVRKKASHKICSTRLSPANDPRFRHANILINSCKSQSCEASWRQWQYRKGPFDMAFYLIIFLSDSSPIISLSCLVTQSVSQPPLPKLPNQIKLNFAQYLSKLLHVFLILFFVKVATYICQFLHELIVLWQTQQNWNLTKNLTCFEAVIL